MRDRFRVRCGEDLARLRLLTATGLGGEELEAMVHNLAGAAGLFGFSALSEAAIAIDDRYAAKALPDADQMAVLERALAETAAPPT